MMPSHALSEENPDDNDQDDELLNNHMHIDGIGLLSVAQKTRPATPPIAIRPSTPVNHNAPANSSLSRPPTPSSSAASAPLIFFNTLSPNHSPKSSPPGSPSTRLRSSSGVQFITEPTQIPVPIRPSTPTVNSNTTDHEQPPTTLTTPSPASSNDTSNSTTPENELLPTPHSAFTTSASPPSSSSPLPAERFEGTPSPTGYWIGQTLERRGRSRSLPAARRRRRLDIDTTTKPQKVIGEAKSDFFGWLFEELRGGSLSEEQDRDQALSQKRTDVYNFLQVPWQVEKLLMFGFFVCFDSFLFLFTILPLRILKAMVSTIFRMFSSRRMSNLELCDFMRGGIVAICYWGLLFVDSSVLYHHIRAQSVLKLYVLYNVLEIFDKLCCSFGQDIFDSLFWSVSRSNHGSSSKHSLRPLPHLIVAMIYVFIHSMVIFYQVVTLNVAINSHSNALLTLLVSNQFVELKGCVFKKFEKENLFQVSCSDMVERFQTAIFLLIVAAQNFSDLNWNFADYYQQILGVFVMVWFSECLVDWIKHAFITKFNHITPDVYGKFSNILYADIVNSRKKGSFLENSHSVSTRIGFVSLPLGCLVLRVFGQILPTCGWMGLALIVMIMMCLGCLKLLIRIILLGMCLTHSVTRQDLEESQKNYSNVFRYTLFKGKIP